MKTNKTFFITSSAVIMAVFSVFVCCDYANAASRVAVRGTPATVRKSVPSVSGKIETPTTTVQTETKTAPAPEPEVIIENKSNQFDAVISADGDSGVSDNYLSDAIRKQRAALAAAEEKQNATKTQNQQLKNNSNSCNDSLRKCMQSKCGDDFTKCATDGDTIFGDKLNACRRDTNCKTNEFTLFAAEIKSDRDMNVRLASYNNVLNCGNQYNACIVKECGTNYNKCLGKTYSDAAIQKCATIAKNCTESDSGLASRFGTVIGKLRENAEKDIKSDEAYLYELRDMMRARCEKLGAMFDERSFDCVYTVNFYAGTDKSAPLASRKAYAGDSFTCMQEWFGINATTFKENAYRATREQTAASSALLGSGVGSAAGLVSSGAIGRAKATRDAKKELKAEQKLQSADEAAQEKYKQDSEKIEAQRQKQQAAVKTAEQEAQDNEQRAIDKAKQN